MDLNKLPEEIIRKIFSYCADDDVYFKFRAVNQKLRQYSENYVQLGMLYCTSYYCTRWYLQIKIDID